MITTEMLQNIRGGDLVDEAGHRIGAIGEIYLDDYTGEPAWATVNTGFFGTSESFVPLDDASLSGDDIRVPYAAEKIKDAPRVDAGQHLDADQEQELYRYYGVRFDTVETRQGDVADRAGLVAGADAASDRVTAADGRDERAALGEDADSLVLHAERVRVGTERVAAGRARLRRYVVEGQQTVSVPVARETVVIERRPVAEGEAVAGGMERLGEREIAVVLTEERPVVSRETVAVEEVGLRKDMHVEERQVTTTVRHEEAELEGVEGMRAERVDGIAD